jgi:hypothetical protein
MRSGQRNLRRSARRFGCPDGASLRRPPADLGRRFTRPRAVALAVTSASPQDTLVRRFIRRLWVP